MGFCLENHRIEWIRMDPGRVSGWLTLVINVGGSISQDFSVRRIVTQEYVCKATGIAKLLMVSASEGKTNPE